MQLHYYLLLSLFFALPNAEEAPANVNTADTEENLALPNAADEEALEDEEAAGNAAEDEEAEENIPDIY